MGTTAEKLDYLNETKKMIRQSLLLLGVNLPVNTPFRDYADALSNIGVDLPQLFAPTVSASAGVVTIIDSENNGAFTEGYVIFVNGVFLKEVDIGESVNLYDYISEDDTYLITAKAIATNFIASASSSAVAVTLENSGIGYYLDDNTYGKTVNFLSSHRVIANDYGSTITLEKEEE